MEEATSELQALIFKIGRNRLPALDFVSGCCFPDSLEWRGVKSACRSPNLGQVFSPTMYSAFGEPNQLSSDKNLDQKKSVALALPLICSKRSPIAVAVSAEIAMNCVSAWKVEIRIGDVGI